MCGIVGMVCAEQVATKLYDSLIQLQHRGQDAAGIITCNERLHFKMGLGLVRDIFEDRHIKRLEGTMGIGHTRYPTSGSKTFVEEVQPLWTSVPNGIAIAHNGNIVNTEVLREEVTVQRKRYLNTSSDSEILLHLFASSLQQYLEADTSESMDDEQFFEAAVASVQSLSELVEGSYSVVGLIKDRGLIAFRDPHGIRPLVLGKKTHAGHDEYIIASEDTMFHMLEFEYVRDIAPGEVVMVTKQGHLFSQIFAHASYNPCIFEYVYFARPDAVINNISVYRSRLRMGENLGKRWKEVYKDLRPDVVIPAPSTSNTMALSMAKELNVEYSEGLYKNPFIGRTFIMSDQAERRQSVRYKLAPQRLEIKDKVVLVVDDSIVRGTTSREIVSMVRDYGAKAVWFASACPPVTHPCQYGVDIPTKGELIASSHTIEEIRAYLGVDILFYQETPDLIEAVMRKSVGCIDMPCHACLGGPYIAGYKEVES